MVNRSPRPAAGAHPYYPVSIEVVDYLANEYSVPALLGLFAAGCVAVFGVTLLVVRQVNPRLGGSDRAAVLWFVLCGTIHTFFEGYFSLNHTRMGGQSDLFGQLWKEYSLSDSRYLTSESFVLCMETLTAVGPAHARPHDGRLTLAVRLWPAVVLCRLLHRHGPPATPAADGRRVARPAVRRHSVLRHLHVRPLPQGGHVLPTRGLLFLVLLLLHELHLDRDSGW